MPNTGWLFGTVSGQESGSEPGWSNLGNLLATDATYATSATLSDSVSAPDFGRARWVHIDSPDLSGIPAGASIDGIEVEVTQSNPGGWLFIEGVQLRINGTASGSTLNAGSNQFNAVTTYGSASNKWGLTPTESQLKTGSGLGVRIRMRNGDSDFGGNAVLDSARFRVTYTAVSAPTVTSVSPSSGSTAGGSAITITGTDFTGATGVTIGGVAATSVSVVNSTTITCVTPAGVAGAKDVVVTTSAGSGTLSSGYTYVLGVDIVGELLMETGIPLREESDEELLIEGTGGLDEAANRVVDSWFGMEF